MKGFLVDFEGVAVEIEYLHLVLVYKLIAGVRIRGLEGLRDRQWPKGIRRRLRCGGGPRGRGRRC